MARLLRILIIVALAAAVLGIPVSVMAQAGAEIIVAPESLDFSIHLPADWQAQARPGDAVFSDYLIFADNAALLQSQLQALDSGMPQDTPDGLSGLVVMFNPSYWQANAPTVEQQIDLFMQGMTGESQLVGQWPLTIGGLYPGTVALIIDPTDDAQVYIGAVDAGAAGVVGFYLGVTPSQNFANADSLLQAIIDTISAPAVSDAQIVSSGGAISPLPNSATATPSASGAETIDYVMEGNLASITLPSDWVVYDYLEQNGVFAYGDTDAAAASRFASVLPDMVDQPPPLTGTGGLVMLYSPADVGLDPAAPDLAALLDGVAANLSGQGYRIVNAGTDSMLADHPGRFIVVQGAEAGVIAVVLFGDQLAYITATSMPDTFDANLNLLDAIVSSLRVPAAPAAATPEATAAATPEATAPVPEPTATATSSGGIGGLGGFRGGLQPTTEPPAARPAIGGLGG